MSRTSTFFQRQAIERIPSPVLDAAGKAVLKAVDAAVEQRWDRAKERAVAAEGNGTYARVQSVRRSFSRELTSVGAATGAAAAVPGVGTAAAVSLLAAELGWFAFRATDLIMTIGAVHGRLNATVEERRAWVLSILAFGHQAADEFATLANEVDQSVTIQGERISAVLAGMAGGDAALDALRRINTTLVSRVMTKYGSRRGILTAGKLLPLGIGAVVGGSANWALARGISNQSVRFFATYHLLVTPPPPSIPPPPEASSLPSAD